MLRITQSASVAAALQYFSRSLSRGDYYFKGLEIAGNWGGKVAEMLGLQGTVDKETFALLLQNLRPDGSPLTERTIENRRPGYDFTFDVPKSVSLLQAFTGDERIIEASRQSAIETIREMEEAMHARVRKESAFSDRQTGNMVWAEFTHLTTRPAELDPASAQKVLEANPTLGKHRDAEGKLLLPDPQLHHHFFVMNATWDAVEAQWKAGDFMRIKRDASYYQAVYHTRLAGELQKLGFSVRATNKAFEIEGIGRDMIETFSRRTREVEKAADELGITDADAKGRLGATTRKGKNADLSRAELQCAWRELLSPVQSDSIHRIASAAELRESPAIDDDRAARESIEYALEHELERVSETSKKRLLSTALERAIGQASVESVRRALLEKNNVLHAVIDGEERLTTREILAEELALMEHVRKGRGCVPPLVSDDYVCQNPLFSDPKADTKEQEAAVRFAMRSQDWLVGVIGKAGTGKTTLLQEVDTGLKARGKKLMVVAPSAEASRGVLRAEGFSQAETVAKLLLNEQAQAALKDAVLWVDESGMLGTKDMRRLLDVAKANGAAKVILAGDPKQIRSVPRGDALRIMVERAGMQAARLEKVQRQKVPELKEAVEAISRGEVSNGIDLLDRNRAIIEAEGKERHEALARAYTEKISEKGARGRRKTALVVSPTHREGEAVTSSIREKLREAGKIGKEDTLLPRTVPLALTNAEKSNPATYAPGMLVQFKQNVQGFRKSERVMVASTEDSPGEVSVYTNDGSYKRLPLDRAKHFQVYRLDELKVAEGDRLRITENSTAKDGKTRLDNGSFVTVKKVLKDGSLKLDTGKMLPRDFGHLSHGYVVTADSAQAKTVDAVYAAIGSESFGATDLRRFYVTLSRAREEARIYTDDREGLVDAVQRSDPRRSAIEMLDSARRERAMRVSRDRAHEDIGRRQRSWTRSRNSPRPTTERRRLRPEREIER